MNQAEPAVEIQDNQLLYEWPDGYWRAEPFQGNVDWNPHLRTGRAIQACSASADGEMVAVDLNLIGRCG